MQSVADARKSLGIPTIFNLLGPLTNPGRARHQLLGVFSPELTDRLATVLREMGSERAWVVHAEDGLDELSTLGPTRVSELSGGHVRTWMFDPKSVGIKYARALIRDCPHSLRRREVDPELAWEWWCANPDWKPFARRSSGQRTLDFGRGRERLARLQSR